MAKETVKRTLELPVNLYSKLDAIAKETDISIAAVIKIACLEYVKKYERENE